MTADEAAARGFFSHLVAAAYLDAEAMALAQIEATAELGIP